MIRIRELSEYNQKQIQELATLHQRAFPKFFLTQLGAPFLKTLYRGYLIDNNSGIIVAEDEDMIVGFIAYSRDYSQFYKGLINNHLIRFAFCSLGAAIRHPSFIKRLFGAFKKSESVEKTEKYVELASICVDPMIESMGVGTNLVNYLKSTVDFDTYAYINHETDADENEKANMFYLKNGFVLSNQFITSQGRKMNEYRFVTGESK